MAARVIVNMPARAKRGEVIEIRTLAGHVMETGFRHAQTGELLPRDIITRFSCSYNGVEVFSADLHPAVAANPLIAFSTSSRIARADRLVGSACSALRRKYVDGAIGRTRQIGSTPYVARCWSMKVTITSVGGRAPPGRNTRTPCAGSR